MVRYSDITKNDIQGTEKNGIKDLTDLKNTIDSIRFSALEGFCSSPVLEDLPVQQDAEYMEKLQATIVSYLNEVQRLIKNDEDFDIKQAVDTLKHIISTPDLIDRFYQSTALVKDLSKGKDYLIHHLLKVMMCALKVGTGMNYSREELLELGLAALFYDVGLFKISEAITEKRERLAESDLNAIKKHTEIGAKILSRFMSEHPMMSRVAYEHHERENGGGYPVGLKGNEICEYAKIIGLVDTFDAMIHDRPYRKSLAQHFSVKELVGSKNSMFSSKVIKAFLDEMGIFPVGSYVKLNNSEIGKVISTSREHPLRPTIEVIIDDHGNEVSGECVINIEKHPVLYVTAAVSDEELTSLGIIQ